MTLKYGEKKCNFGKRLFGSKVQNQNFLRFHMVRPKVRKEWRKHKKEPIDFRKELLNIDNNFRLLQMCD